MPWTLWRYTFIELWRLLLICTAVMVSVIAFAAAVKPLAEGALSPLGAIKFMLFAVPPMLAYALPFSAGFAASLAYHRMAQDNETVAAHSGGVSHKKVLIPAVLSALILAGSVSGLNEWVIPKFLRSMERMITLDVAQMMIRQIERGQAAEFGDVMIYADEVDEIDPPEGSPARQMFLLQDVAAVQLNAERQVVDDVTVRRAWLVIAPNPADPGKTICGMQFEDGVGFVSGQGLRKVEEGRPPPIPIPEAFEDDPKYLTFAELRSLRLDPDEMGFIDTRRLKLARFLAFRELRERLDEDLARTGRLTMIGDGGRRLEISADRVVRAEQDAWYLTREGEPIEVRRFEPEDGGGFRLYVESVDEAWLRLEDVGPDDEAVWTGVGDGPSLGFTVQMLGVRTESAGGVPTERPRRDFRGMRLRNDPLAQMAELGSDELLAEAGVLIESGKAAGYVEDATADLEKMIAKLHREITSKQQERMAMAAACFVMVLLGAISALRHKDSLPLVVYLWSFFPALVMILLISSGQQHTHGRDVAVGVLILWSGIAAGLVLTGIEYLKIARH